MPASAKRLLAAEAALWPAAVHETKSCTFPPPEVGVVSWDSQQEKVKLRLASQCPDAELVSKTTHAIEQEPSKAQQQVIL